MDCIKNNEEYLPIYYSYRTYVDVELDYLNSEDANADKEYLLDTLLKMRSFKLP